MFSDMQGFKKFTSQQLSQEITGGTAPIRPENELRKGKRDEQQLTRKAKGMPRKRVTGNSRIIAVTDLTSKRPA
jgi:hypothetical protein